VLARLLQHLPTLIKDLPAAQLEAFFGLLQLAQTSQPLTTSREERQLKRTLQEYLNTKGVENSLTAATYLSQMGIAPPLEMAMPILQAPDCTLILERVLDFATVHNNSQNIQIAVDRAAKIVFALKSYSHQDPESHYIKASIEDSLETILVLYQNQIKRGIDVVKNYLPVPDIFCYPDELSQVWSNLISNAIQAMDYRGTLEVFIGQQQDHIVVQVTDHGPGIPVNIQPKIFDPFFTTKEAGEGSGLGLNIVKKIIAKHQGNIELSSKPGNTTFKVWLPITAANLVSTH
jgi:two-component system, NtrC family, sensor kinase